MSSFFPYSFAAASLFLASVPAVAKELPFPSFDHVLASNEFDVTPAESTQRQIPLRLDPPKTIAVFKPFTGKIKGKKVRLRVSPDLDSHIVRELPKEDLIVIVGEKEDFWTVQPPLGTKAYIFRSFVLDNVVEGNRVNVRLSPDLEAPIIGHLNAGTRLDHPEMSAANNKWYEIPPPEDTVFYISKEFVEYAGGPELKAQTDKRKSTAEQFLEAACLVSQAELCKSFEEMDIDRVSRNFTTIINEYSDFPDCMSQAKEALSSIQEAYLQKKISYLEAKTARIANEKEIPLFHESEENELALENPSHENPSINDKMKSWAPIEEAVYLSWLAISEQKDMASFYEEQALNATMLTGIVEAYTAPVKNKPGDFILKNRDIPVAYLYSTKVNLQNFVGKRIGVVATPRSNNNFAFPAYFVLDIE